MVIVRLFQLSPSICCAALFFLPPFLDYKSGYKHIFWRQRDTKTLIKKIRTMTSTKYSCTIPEIYPQSRLFLKSTIFPYKYPPLKTPEWCSYSVFNVFIPKLKTGSNTWGSYYFFSHFFVFLILSHSHTLLWQGTCLEEFTWVFLCERGQQPNCMPTENMTFQSGKGSTLASQCNHHMNPTMYLKKVQTIPSIWTKE